MMICSAVLLIHFSCYFGTRRGFRRPAPSRRAGERSEAEQSASTNMAFVTVWFLEKPGTELTPVENCLRAVLELVRRRQNSNVLKVHSFPVILILNMP